MAQGGGASFDRFDGRLAAYRAGRSRRGSPCDHGRRTGGRRRICRGGERPAARASGAAAAWADRYAELQDEPGADGTSRLSLSPLRLPKHARGDAPRAGGRELRAPARMARLLQPGARRATGAARRTPARGATGARGDEDGGLKEAARFRWWTPDATARARGWMHTGPDRVGSFLTRTYTGLAADAPTLRPLVDGDSPERGTGRGRRTENGTRPNAG